MRTTDAQGDGIHVTLKELLDLGLNARRSLKPLRKRANSVRAAGQRSRALGRGLDFAEVRAYQAGDDIRMIDWNVTARTNQVHTKLFEEEKERPTFIVADFSRAMLFGTRHSLKSVAAARMAAQLAWMAAASGERVGGLVFNDAQHTEVKPAASSRGVIRLLSALVEVHQHSIANLHTAKTNTSGCFIDAIQRLKKMAHPGSRVFFISDFVGLSLDDEGQSDRVGIRWLQRHSEFFPVRVIDPVEIQLPRRGAYTVTDGQVRTRFNSADLGIRRLHQSAFERRSACLLSLCGGRRLASYVADLPVDSAASQLLAHIDPAAERLATFGD